MPKINSSRELPLVTKRADGRSRTLSVKDFSYRDGRSYGGHCRLPADTVQSAERESAGSLIVSMGP